MTTTAVYVFAGVSWALVLVLLVKFNRMPPIEVSDSDWMDCHVPTKGDR